MEPRRVDEPTPRYFLTCPGTAGQPCDKCRLFREDDGLVGFDPFAALKGEPVKAGEPRRDAWGRPIGCSILLGMPAHNYVRTGGDGGCKRCRCLPSHEIHGASGWWEGTRVCHGLTASRYK